MIFGSVCSGIEAASVAWAPLGWRCAWVSEIDPFASAVLAHRYPDVPNLGDFTRIGVDNDGGTQAPESIDLLVGGTPCQDFSVAGQREGLEGADGRLALEYMALVGRLRPRWLVWENVPGVLSQHGGRDFGTILGALAERGYGFAYRVLDAQFTGVPQRRRRVFLVGYLGDWRPPAAVLLERHSLSGHPAPRREAGQRLADTLTVGANQCGGWPGDFVEVAWDVARTVEAHHSRSDAETETFVLRAGDSTGSAVSLVAAFSAGQSAGAGTRAFQPDQSPTLRGASSGTNQVPAVCAIHENQRGELFLQDTAALNGPGGKPGQGYAAALAEMQVRRLTPRECERLQGLPDDWTLVPFRGKPATDTNRYRAIGNSMAVPVVRWIGARIQAVDDLLRALDSAQ